MGQLSGVGVLDKSVAVLAAAARTPVGLSELVAATGLPRATAHRLAVALEAHRLLVRDPAGRWVPGPRLGELARGAPDPLVTAAGPVLTRLRDRSGESAQLYRRDGDERVCVAAAERTTGLRTTVALGARLPMTAGSGAQVLAAWADDDELPAGARFGPRTLAEVRRRGWAYSVAQREAGVASVSAPVRDRAGEVVAAISVSGPVERLSRRPGPRFAPLVTAAAAALSSRL
jgi:DNA-binding IclR family transcriptional regulator